MIQGLGLIDVLGEPIRFSQEVRPAPLELTRERRVRPQSVHHQVAGELLPQNFLGHLRPSASPDCQEDVGVEKVGVEGAFGFYVEIILWSWEQELWSGSWTWTP